MEESQKKNGQIPYKHILSIIAVVVLVLIIIFSVYHFKYSYINLDLEIYINPVPTNNETFELRVILENTGTINISLSNVVIKQGWIFDNGVDRIELPARPIDGLSDGITLAPGESYVFTNNYFEPLHLLEPDLDKWSTGDYTFYCLCTSTSRWGSLKSNVITFTIE